MFFSGGIAVALFGNLWTDLNPWTGPVRTLRSLLGRTGGMGLARFGHLPAVAGFFAFAWYEIVSLSPDDPAELAIVASVYWLLIFALAVGEGEDWLPKGELFSAFFAFVGSMAPFWAKYEGRRVEVHAGVPGAQIMSFPPLTKSAIAFVTLMLATVSFDGLHESFRWVAFLGLNPLDYPGRSAVTLPNTIGLFATWMLMSALIVGAILLTLRLARSDLPLSDIAGPWILSFLPIAAAYHIAHYLVALLTQGQYAIAALSDPLGTGADYLGLGPHWVSFGFLSQQHAVWTIWIVQFAIILGAHLLAVLLGDPVAVVSVRDQDVVRGQDRRRLGRDVAGDLGMAAIVEHAVAIVDDCQGRERVVAQGILRVAVEDGAGTADRLRPEAGTRPVGDRRVERDAPDRDVDVGQIAAVAAAHERQRPAIGRLLGAAADRA